MSPSDAPARGILLAAASALAHPDGSAPRTGELLRAIAEGAGAESAAIVVAGRTQGLEITASFGLPAPALAALAAAVRDPGHPIARTVADAVPTFDVAPTRPGGPALRSHLPLVVAHGGARTVVGVLALAHEQPLEPETRELVLASADLAALAVERATA